MSKQIKLCCFLFSIALNHSITDALFFHLLKLDDSVEYRFANFAYFRFCGVNQSAGRFICKVRFMIFQCYECAFIQTYIYTDVHDESVYRCICTSVYRRIQDRDILRKSRVNKPRIFVRESLSDNIFYCLFISKNLTTKTKMISK